jgi:hypothetical protein
MKCPSKKMINEICANNESMVNPDKPFDKPKAGYSGKTSMVTVPGC